MFGTRGIRLSALVAASLMALVTVQGASASTAGAATSRVACADVEAVFARGSGEALRDKEFTHFDESLTKCITGSITLHTYELGT